MTKPNLLCLAFASLLPIAVVSAPKPQSPLAEDQYLTAKTSDAVAKLQEQIASGKVNLAFDEQHGYLPALLKQLDIGTSSQLLVFSKTSLQSRYISPSNPRALYFNDRAFVGWIDGAPLIEIASVDSTHGPIFYTLLNSKGPRPIFTRQTYDCIQCHDSTMTRHVPGFMARSVFVSTDGQPRFASGSKVTTAESPLNERWGGWYVTGTHGDQRHMGNEPARGPESDSKIDMDKGANVRSLTKYFDTTSYLSSHSDIVALMVAEHQMGVQNLLTRANYATRNAFRDEAIYAPSRSDKEPHTEQTARRIALACEPVVEALLCVGEVKLTAPILGTTTFAKDYSSRYPRDSRGRSLGDLDLQSRLLRYPCSPMIYSPALDGLPSEARNQIFHRLRDVLVAKSLGSQYSHLLPADRQAILQILDETKPDFRAHGRN